MKLLVLHQLTKHDWQQKEIYGARKREKNFYFIPKFLIHTCLVFNGKQKSKSCCERKNIQKYIYRDKCLDNLREQFQKYLMLGYKYSERRRNRWNEGLPSKNLKGFGGSKQCWLYGCKKLEFHLFFGIKTSAWRE